MDGDSEWISKHTHRSDPNDTSSEAAEAARRVRRAQKRIVFEFLLRRPMTQDELRDETGLGDNAAKRCSDLKNEGWVRDSRVRGLSKKGKSATLLEVTEFGRAAYEGREPNDMRRDFDGQGELF